jgi:diacylglycerol kinase
MPLVSQRVRGVVWLNRRGRVFSVRVLNSFVFAFAGASYLFRTQRNARVHLAFAVAACGVAAWLKISRTDWAIIILTIGMVLILEGLNTAIEAAVDLASPAYHDLAKTAKDVAAAMVLIAAIASVVIGLLILGPPLWHKFF